ncbi:MAG: hypothetical protein ABI435_04925 [Pseudolysinimonas sp.]
MLTDDDRHLIRLTLAEIADVLDTMATVAVGSDPPSDSLAGQHLASELNVPSFGGFPIVMEANFSMLLAALSGTAHLRAYCDLLETGTTALGTLTRGAVEAFSKAYYLLSPDSTPELVARHLALSKHELVHPQKHSRFRDVEGNEFSGKDYPKVHDQIQATLPLPTPAPVYAPQRVQALLTAGLREGTASPEYYSQLSGAAHAVTSALGMYLQAPDRSPRLVYPRAIALDHCGYLFVAVATVSERCISNFGLPAQSQDEWRLARLASERALRSLGH